MRRFFTDIFNYVFQTIEQDLYDLYILECDCDKYYIHKLARDENIEDVTNEWLSLYPPLKVIEKIENVTDADYYVEKYIKLYGNENVRFYI